VTKQCEEGGVSMKPAEWTHKVDPVFLVGCGRSGTTWLQSMLACHPEIYTGPEPHFFSAFSTSEPIYQIPFHNHRVGLAEYWSPEDYYGWMKAGYWSLLSALPEPTATPQYFLDKTPGQCEHAEFILRIFPQARFLHLIRDGRAVAASLLRASRNANHGMTAGQAASHWVRMVKAGRNIRSGVPSPDQYYELKYEDLRRNPTSELSKIFEWLNLPADSTFVTSAVDSNHLVRVSESENLFPSIPMTTRRFAVQEKPAYPKWFIGPAPCEAKDVELTHLESLRLQRTAGTLLAELGYPDVRKLSILECILISERIRRWLKLRTV
jgi:hypothetical protein